MGSTITKLSAEAVDENMVLQVHDEELISELKKISEQGGGIVDADTRMSSASWKGARSAAGAGLQAIDELQNGTATSLLRSTSTRHHATISKSMGFCLLNNVAVTAKKLRNEGEKVLIVDYDAIMEMEPKTSSIPTPTFYSYLSIRCLFTHGLGRLMNEE